MQRGLPPPIDNEHVFVSSRTALRSTIHPKADRQKTHYATLKEKKFSYSTDEIFNASETRGGFARIRVRRDG